MTSNKDHIVIGLRYDVTCCTECRYKNNQNAADLIESLTAKIARLTAPVSAQEILEFEDDDLDFEGLFNSIISSRQGILDSSTCKESLQDGK